MMPAALTIAAHELRTRTRDGTALLVALVAPVVLASLFSFALGGDDPPLRTDIGVVDAGGARAEELNQAIAASVELRESITVSSYMSGETAREALDRGTVGALIVFADTFQSDLTAGRPADISVSRSATAPLAGIVAQSLADQYATVVDGRATAVRTAILAGLPEDQVQRVRDAGPAAGAGLVLGADVSVGRPVQAASYYGPAMASLFAFFVVGATTRSLLTERRLGTLSRMQSAPISRSAVLTGKGIVAVVLAMTSMSVTWLSSVLLFGADWGDPRAVVLLLLAHALAATAITLLVASRCRTDAQADGCTTVLAFVFAILGGNLVALYDLPEILQRLSLLTPNGWVMSAVSTLTVRQGDLASIALPLAVIMAIAVTTAALAVLGLRRVSTS